MFILRTTRSSERNQVDQAWRRAIGKRWASRRSLSGVATSLGDFSLTWLSGPKGVYGDLFARFARQQVQVVYTRWRLESF
jgi:hypothetical protein